MLNMCNGIGEFDCVTRKAMNMKVGVTPDLLDTVKGSRLSCTRSDFAFQEQSAGQHDYNLQTIPVEV